MYITRLLTLPDFESGVVLYTNFLVKWALLYSSVSWLYLKLDLAQSLPRILYIHIQWQYVARAIDVVCFSELNTKEKG